MTDDQSGDVRVWQSKYESALRHIETGNVIEARKILTQLSKESPSEDIRKSAAKQLEQFKPDWVAYAFLGGTFVIILILTLKYVF